MMIQSALIMFKTTVVLIGFCIAGVIGVVDSAIPYRDAIMVPIVWPPAAFVIGGFMFYGMPDSGSLDHEYGHVLQEREYGPLYFALVAIPSMLSAVYRGVEGHRSSGVEIDATRRGSQ